MTIKEKLVADMKQAMKDKAAGKLRLSVIRMVRASIKNAEIDRRHELSEDETVEVLAREVKMRRDASEEFAKANRPDLVENLRSELDILLAYLPQQLSEGEIRSLVQEAVQATNATGPKDMGKVMTALMPKVKGRADGKLVNQFVRDALKN